MIKLEMPLEIFLTIQFIILKLTGGVLWSWGWVFFPLLLLFIEILFKAIFSKKGF